MKNFQVYLAGNGDHAPYYRPVLNPSERRRLGRQYRTYLPGPSWLPSPPVFVCLTGRNGRPMPRTTLSVVSDYELPLLAFPTRRKMKKVAVAVAAAAAVLLPAASQAASAVEAAPPSISRHPESTRISRDWGPPTAPLTTAPRATNSLQPLLDAQGRPVELAAFHTNVTSHSNALVPHSNAWANHSNTPHAHSNVWNNHANAPGGSHANTAQGQPDTPVPHTNIVPGDFIF